MAPPLGPEVRASVVVPARNEARGIAAVVRAVLAQRRPGLDLEVVVVDDGSDDGTPGVAEAAGARVLRLEPGQNGGNPGAARNRGARFASGDPLIFLDADCEPAPGWLEALLREHERGAAVVGGALGLPPGLPASARLDYYASAYSVHPGRPAGDVVSHTPANLSVRRPAFLSTSGFLERQPVADGHEELAWQAELTARGERIRFTPDALVYHHNRPGFGNILRRNYRWAYSAVEAKAETGAARAAWLYRYPRLLVAAGIPLSFAQVVWILGSWLRAGALEPVVMLPGLLLARAAYATGLTVGGVQWLRHRRNSSPGTRARWR